MHPILIESGFFDLHTYGVLIAVGFLLALTLGPRQARREGEDPDRIVDLAFYVLLAGLLGARVVFIFTKLPEYVENPVQILYFWRGGLVWYGGFIAAALYTVHYCRRHRLDYWKVADISIPYVALAHAWGRLGCLAAGCCFGRPTDSALGIHFPGDSPAQHAQQLEGLIAMADAPLPVHATQLYEATFELAMFWFLLVYRKRKRFHGQLLLLWLALYPLARSVIEAFRGDKERGVYVLSTSQWISILVATAAVAVGVHLRRQRRAATGA